MPTPTLEQLTKILEKSEETSKVILDPSPVNGLENVLDSSVIDNTTPNEIEYQEIFESHDYDHQVLQTETEGVWIDEGLIKSPSVDEVFDITVAGDTFNGYLASKLSQGMNFEEAALFTGLAATKSVKKQGSQISIPEI
jgi:ribokinase